MNNYITTYTGMRVVPYDLKPEDIRIEDIAHALSMLCRGNGHVKTFWSVGEHCILAAKEAMLRGYGRRLALACLLHDASECYLSDVPSPFKAKIDGYRETEDRILSMVYERFLGSDLTEEEFRLLDGIDKDLLYYDLSVLLGEKMEREEPQMQAEISYALRPFQEAEKEYLELFEKLKE
ncbi:MAG: hypothetical protein IJJ25_09590 [Lachnospiraceae bacterium]|nr:hypothetical protein [Lachnospiraceae bacterium]